MDKQPRRENHTGVLIDYKAFIDMDIGLTGFLYQSEDPNISEIIDKEFCSVPDLVLCIDKAVYPNFRHKIFIENSGLSPEMIDGILNDVENENIVEIADHAFPIPSIQRLLEVAKDVKIENVIKPQVLVRDGRLLAPLRKWFPNIEFIDGTDLSKINFRQYARLILEDIEDIYKFPNIEFCHITIMAYAKNMIVQDDGTYILKPDPVLKFGTSNQFDVIDPIPNYIKEEILNGTPQLSE